MKNKNNSSSKIVANEILNNWLNESEENNRLQNCIKKDMRKPYYKENYHKFLLGSIGIYLFPLINIFLAHKGISILFSTFSLPIFLITTISILIPILLEYAQYSTLKPLIKKIVKNQQHSYKDYLDFIVFTIVIILMTTFGLYNISERVGDARFLFEYKLLISSIISISLALLTIYSHKSVASFNRNSTKEFIDLHPDYLHPNFIELNNAQNAYQLALSSLIKTKPVEFVTEELDIQNTPVPSAETGHNQIGFTPSTTGEKSLNLNVFDSTLLSVENRRYLSKYKNVVSALMSRYKNKSNTPTLTAISNKNHISLSTVNNVKRIIDDLI